MRTLAFSPIHKLSPMLQLPLLPTPKHQNQQSLPIFRSNTPSCHLPSLLLPSYKKFTPKPTSSFDLKTPRLSLCCCYDSSSNSSSSAEIDEFEVELGRLLSLLPEEMRQKVNEHPEQRHLIEIVMDLGRMPFARFPSGDFVLSDCNITLQDLERATSQIGDFATDNRAGMSRTLHRISAIRNRKGVIIGLTCRVGRAISGSANLLRDLVKDGGSLLLIGPPGVGKTTIIREIARMLADDYRKRVMIVDTSNEIGGDGDIPHAGIGGARRMQVPSSDMQHKVLIEAVENHMPQVIVIDEIGTKLEAMAASTIAQRGIQLVATAHGVTIENLTMNPSLEMLVGGIQSVTLGDEEASRRGVQKTVLERKGPSTFTCGVEIISKTELRVHRSLEATVDALLSGRPPKFEVRKINAQGYSDDNFTFQSDPSSDISPHMKEEFLAEDPLDTNAERDSHSESISEYAVSILGSSDPLPVRLFAYGILETTVVQALKQMRMGDAVELTDNVSDADAFLALHAKLKKNSRIQAVAKSRDIPIYVTKTSSLEQIIRAIRSFMSKHADGFRDFEAEDKSSSSEKIDALEEARLAIEQVVIPKGEVVELLPRSSHIISLQIDLIQKYQLQTEKVGKETDVRLRILPDHTGMEERTRDNEMVDTGTGSQFTDFSCTDDINFSQNGIARLPLLSD